VEITLERRLGNPLGQFSFWDPKKSPRREDEVGLVGLVVSAAAGLTAGEAAIAAMAGRGDR
jgi:hypothetical protein